MSITSVNSRGFVRRPSNFSPVVLLETDTQRFDCLPDQIKAAANLSGSTSAGTTFAGLIRGDVPNGADGVLTWLAGETILSGSAAVIRHDLRVPGRRTFVPVHVPCLEDMPLIMVQPRWSRRGQRCDYWNFQFRMQTGDDASPALEAALAETPEPWAKLSSGILAETKRFGAGVETLVRLW